MSLNIPPPELEVPPALCLVCQRDRDCNCPDCEYDHCEACRELVHRTAARTGEQVCES